MQNLEKFEIHFHDSLPLELHKILYKFELAIFSSIFSLTPKTYSKYREFRPINRLTASTCYLDSDIIGLILNDKLNPYHTHCAVVATDSKFRNLGISQLLWQFNYNKLRSRTKYITLWCDPNSPLKKYIFKNISAIYNEQSLCEVELKLRKEYIKTRRMRAITVPLRLVKNFYKTTDGSFLPAEFYALKV